MEKTLKEIVDVSNAITLYAEKAMEEDEPDMALSYLKECYDKLETLMLEL
jgi:hypothetical protein